MAGTKTIENDQWGRVSDTGSVVSPNLFSDPNDGRAPMVDPHGRVVVRIADGSGFLPSSNAGTVDSSASLLNTKIVRAASYTTLMSIVGFNPNAVLYYFQLFNRAIAPVTTVTIPIQSIIVPANSEFSWIPALPGNSAYVNVGLVWAVSTTAAVFTSPGVGVGTFWVNVEYIV